jgi:hypothetical protein
VKKLSIIRKVLFDAKFFLIFFVGGILYGLLYSVMTNLVDLRNGFGNIHYSFTPTSTIFVIVFSVLGGTLLALQIFAIRNKQKSVKSANVGFLATFLSFFNVTCPFCKPLLLSFIGFSGSLAILKYGLLLAFVSILLLIISIYLVTYQIEKSKLYIFR